MIPSIKGMIVAKPKVQMLAIYAGKSLKGSDVTNVKQQVTQYLKCFSNGIKVDNGSEFISKIVDKWAYENNVELDFSIPERRIDNSYFEFFNGNSRDECLNANCFFGEDAQETFDIWREGYNSFRPHSSLGDIPPNEYLKE